ncbi:MAG TPA: valine--tRNA ligase [Thermoplasmata archaeon]|nr:valine--tRNA ligase [Thermoplasmata archaeon]
MSGGELPPRFDPALLEPRWQAAWAAADLFRPPERSRSPGVFTLALPPPNVTGVLTLGHMLGGTAMDVLVRWHRMRGEATLWLPGVDAASLATTVEVRRRLARDGVRLEELPPAEAVERIEEWRAEHERVIRAQLARAGFSLDWSRYRYTMDEGNRRATIEAFLRLHRKGLIYRGERIVNWDPVLRTAISDLEVVHKEETATLLTLRYLWADGSPGGVPVATVRPETIFGDVAVAVHPDDARHRAAVGRSVRVPLTDRTVPVIADPGIDPTFGSGALKVTPRHDLLDYEVARRHSELAKPPSILDERARLVGDWVPERFQGLDRDAGRTAVTEALHAAGLVEGAEPYLHAVARSERSDAVVEPLLSTQWFVRMDGLARRAAAAVEEHAVQLHPERWTPSFFRWMETIQDWCISRQVVWGHRIPVYACDACHAEVAAAEPPERCAACGGRAFTQDPDVLDTWFTSWLWPLATLGWPETTADLDRFYPTDVLVTGRDIMFFWVARMIMAGYEFTGKPPFSDVYFTGMLRDPTGRRMSKHLGNSPDPLEVIGANGADAVRFALSFPNPVDQDGPFGAASLEGARHFLTKVWNVVRFVRGHLPPGTDAPRGPLAVGPNDRLEERWIAARFRATLDEVNEALEHFEFTRAATLLHGFLWHDLADRYVELAKETLTGANGVEGQRTARAVLLFVTERSLRLLHPFAPHVTEELWHALPHDGEFLATAPWPEAPEVPPDPEAVVAMEVVLDAIRSFRNLRAEARLPPGELLEAWARPVGADQADLLKAQAGTIAKQARLRAITLLSAEAPKPAGALAGVTTFAEYFLPAPAESASDIETLRRERAKLADLLARAQSRLADAGFRARAPGAVVREHEEKARELAERVQKIDAHLAAAPAEGGAA